uniref:Uncharacterized protein n=1 Tax=Timema genevievae TaxID=629358 RepID=A0A7R9PNM2_TIMGE|nr:unnamed protein product [Timema genevievae]
MERGEIQVKGKAAQHAGVMKTYWLEKKDFRSPLTRMPMCGPKPEWEKSAERGSILGMVGVSDDRKVYSPVMFHDVARRSIGSSPIKTIPHRESRSNSMGAVFLTAYNNSPSAGCELSHLEVFARLKSPLPAVGYQPILPPCSPHGWSISPRGSLELNEVPQRLSESEDDDEDSGDTTLPGSQARTSQSDGDLCVNSNQVVQSDNEDKEGQGIVHHHQHNHQHNHHSFHQSRQQQCCAGFGGNSPGKHRLLHSNSCCIL